MIIPCKQKQLLIILTVVEKLPAELSPRSKNGHAEGQRNMRVQEYTLFLPSTWLLYITSKPVRDEVQSQDAGIS